MVPTPFSLREPPSHSLFQPFFLFQPEQERSKENSPSANPYNRPPCGSGNMPSKDSGNFSITACGQDRASPSPPVADGAPPKSLMKLTKLKKLFPNPHASLQ